MTTRLGRWILRPSKWGERILSAFKYLLGALTIFGGIKLILSNPSVVPGALGSLYGSEWGVVCFGVLAVLAGLTLILGKAFKNRHMTGLGLFFMFLIYLFSFVLNSIAFGAPHIENLVFTVICGSLYLRWRFKTAYYDPDHFIDDAQQGPRTFEHH